MANAPGASCFDRGAEVNDCERFADALHLDPDGLELEARLVAVLIVRTRLLTPR